MVSANQPRVKIPWTLPERFTERVVFGLFAVPVLIICQDAAVLYADSRARDLLAAWAPPSSLFDRGWTPIPFIFAIGNVGDRAQWRCQRRPCDIAGWLIVDAASSTSVALLQLLVLGDITMPAYKVHSWPHASVALPLSSH